MISAESIQEVLTEMPELHETLGDPNVKHVTISAQGYWTFEKLGRLRSGGDPLARAAISRLAALIPESRPARCGEWAIRRFEGVGGASLLIERLPVAVADRLPQEILTTLKKQIRHAGNGVVLGQPGCGKAALLLWLALQIPDEPVLYISDNPPAEFPGNHIIHVFPPTTIGARRSLERFVRIASTVMWDRVSSTDDLLTLFGFSGARRRWFTVDAPTVAAGLRLLARASSTGHAVPFATLLALDTSVIGRPEARNLVLHRDEEWQEPFCAEESCLELIAEFVGAAPIPERGEPAAQIPAPSLSEDSPRTVPVDVDLEDVEGRGAAIVGEAITGMLAREEMRELRERGVFDDPEPPRARPSFAKRRTASGNVPEETRSYVNTPGEIGLPETTSSIIEAMSLPRFADSTAAQADKLEVVGETTYDDSEVDDDFSGVFHGDVDFERFAEELMSEVSEADSASVVPEDHLLGFGATNPEMPVYLSEDDLELIVDSDDETRAGSVDLAELAAKMGSTDSSEEPESTKEFTLNERLLMLRQRRQDDD